MEAYKKHIRGYLTDMINIEGITIIINGTVRFPNVGFLVLLTKYMLYTNEQILETCIQLMGSTRDMTTPRSY